MKYCKKCKRMHNDSEELCANCKRPLYPVEHDDTPVFLLSSGGFDKQLLQAALEDSSIPFDSVPHKHSLSAQTVLGYDNAQVDILVPYSDYEKAYDVCVGIGAIKPEGEEVEVLEDEPEPEQEPEMSSAKRTAIKIVSAILLIVLCAGVIWGTDYILGWIKGLFGMFG